MLGKLRRAIASPAPYAHKWLKVATGRKQLPLSWRKRLGDLLPPNRGISRFRSLYVVTYGRTGSTLLTSYLSHLPGIDLKGENFMFPLFGFEAEERITKARRKSYSGRESKTSPWYGAHQFNPLQWRVDQLDAMLNQLYPQQLIPKTIGFKEIRWEREFAFDRFEESLDWLLSLRSPGGAVLLTRDLDQVMNSAWWATMAPAEQAEARARLAELDQKIGEFAAAHPERAIHITYESFTSTPAEASRLCTWLGVAFDERLWREVLDRRHSYQPRG